MSWLVAAMEAGVLEGDMLTGIELSTGLVQGKQSRNTVKDGSRAGKLNFDAAKLCADLSTAI
jgi:hypothetical protein